MTISVDGRSDVFISQKNIIATDAFAAKNQQARDGRVAIGIFNQANRFAERRFERLLIEQHAVDIFSGTISGMVLEDNAPVSRVVRLYRRRDGQIAGEAVSNAGTGAFAFSNIEPGEEYYAIAFDNVTLEPDFNALIYDRVIAL